jgi:NAD-dependent DNA ligase
MKKKLEELRNIGPELAEALSEDGWTVHRLATAGTKQLERYPGIGSVRARRIIEEARRIINALSVKTVRCVWHTRLVVPAEQTPTGTRYDFQPGEQQEVALRDVGFLLSLKRESRGCCSGSPVQEHKFFEEVL